MRKAAGRDIKKEKETKKKQEINKGEGKEVKKKGIREKKEKKKKEIRGSIYPLCEERRKIFVLNTNVFVS